MGLMQLPRLLASLRIARRVERLVSDIAQQCRTPLRDRVTAAGAEMSAPQLRGYITAHATPTVRRAVDAALARQPELAAAGDGEVLRQSTERVVALVTADLARARELPPRRLAG